MLVVATNVASPMIKSDSGSAHSGIRAQRTEQQPRVLSSPASAENRFQSVIAKLAAEDWSTAAEWRVRDTDFRPESSALTKNQILQQAGTAMLAQVNSMPQSVLQQYGNRTA